MTDHQRLTATGLLFASVLLLAPASASAQLTRDNLSTWVKLQFDKVYSDGTLGRDWCYNVETERDYTYWYAAFKTMAGAELKGVQIRNPARIQALYKDTSDGLTKYSSIFIGLENDQLPFTPFDLNQPAKPPSAAQAAGGKAQATVEAKANLEEPPNTTCLSLADFLQAYVLPYRLKVTAAYAERQEDEQTFDLRYTYRYWIFNRRAHKIRGVTRFKIDLEDWNNAQPVSGTTYLVVGFGGGAGP